MMSQNINISTTPFKLVPLGVRKKFYGLMGRLLCKTFVERLKEGAAKCETVTDYVDFVFSFEFRILNILRFPIIKPAQIKWEILSLLKILADLKPKAVIEIGTASGGTLFLWTRVADSEATIISIDLPGGPFGGGYLAWRIPLYESFALGNQKIYLLRADSHRESTFNKVREILGSSKVDFLFIDGDHSYEGVKKDFEMYSGLVGGGGVVALHDIVHHPFLPECQVEKFWQEIKRSRRFLTKEIISHPHQTWGGIGLVFV
jgi:predicted O-methyltransferase YrrM